MQGPHEFRSLSSVIGAFAPCTINGAQGGPQVKLGVGLSFGTMQLTDLSIGAPTLPRFPPRRSALAGEKLGGFRLCQLDDPARPSSDDSASISARARAARAGSPNDSASASVSRRSSSRRR